MECALETIVTQRTDADKLRQIAFLSRDLYKGLSEAQADTLHRCLDIYCLARSFFSDASFVRQDETEEEQLSRIGVMASQFRRMFLGLAEARTGRADAAGRQEALRTLEHCADWLGNKKLTCGIVLRQTDSVRHIWSETTPAQFTSIIIGTYERYRSQIRKDHLLPAAPPRIDKYDPENSQAER